MENEILDESLETPQVDGTTETTNEDEDQELLKQYGVLVSAEYYNVA